MLARTPGASLARQGVSSRPTPSAEKCAVQNQGVRTVRGPRGYAPPPSDTASLPAEVLKALKAIAHDMRNVPREIIVDRHETIHLLSRLARRLEGVAALRVAFTPPPPKRSPVAPQGVPAPQGVLAAAEAVFTRGGHNDHTSGLSGHALAAAVFVGGDLHNEDTSAKGTQAVSTLGQGTHNVRTPRRRDEVRTVTGRKGKAVPVLLRAARAAGQIELF